MLDIYLHKAKFSVFLTLGCKEFMGEDVFGKSLPELLKEGFDNNSISRIYLISIKLKCSS
jgi:hypothetical protein